MIRLTNTYWPGVNVEKAWYQNGRLHRDDNKPAVEKLDGSCKWYRRGQEVK